MVSVVNDRATGDLHCMSEHEDVLGVGILRKIDDIGHFGAFISSAGGAKEEGGRRRR